MINQVLGALQRILVSLFAVTFGFSRGKSKFSTLIVLGWIFDFQEILCRILCRIEIFRKFCVFCVDTKKSVCMCVLRKCALHNNPVTGHLEYLRGILGHFGASWASFGNLGHLRGILGILWASWESSGYSGHLQAFSGHTGHLMGIFWTFWASWASCRRREVVPLRSVLLRRRQSDVRDMR